MTSTIVDGLSGLSIGCERSLCTNDAHGVAHCRMEVNVFVQSLLTFSRYG